MSDLRQVSFEELEELLPEGGLFERIAENDEMVDAFWRGERIGIVPAPGEQYFVQIVVTKR